MNTDEAVESSSVSRWLEPGAAMAQRYDDVWDSVWRQPYVPASVLELCRLRIARMHGVAAELESPPRPGIAAAIDAGKRAAVLAGSYARDGSISPAECAAVEFAEVYAMDPQAITDELAGAVAAHFGEPGLVALIEALGFIDGRIRLARMLGPLLDGGTRHA